MTREQTYTLGGERLGRRNSAGEGALGGVHGIGILGGRHDDGVIRVLLVYYKVDFQVLIREAGRYNEIKRKITARKAQARSRYISNPPLTYDVNDSSNPGTEEGITSPRGVWLEIKTKSGRHQKRRPVRSMVPACQSMRSRHQGTGCVSGVGMMTKWWSGDGGCCPTALWLAGQAVAGWPVCCLSGFHR